MEQRGHFLICINFLTQGWLFTKTETKQLESPLSVFLCVLVHSSTPQGLIPFINISISFMECINVPPDLTHEIVLFQENNPKFPPSFKRKERKGECTEKGSSRKVYNFASHEKAHQGWVSLQFGQRSDGWDDIWVTVLFSPVVWSAIIL